MKNNHYLSTRGGETDVSASKAIIEGLAKDGGLFVPAFLHDLKIDLSQITDLSYSELAEKIFGLFLTDFSADDIHACVHGAYETGAFEKLPNDAPVALTSVSDRTFLELYHGPTCAFKDMALTILPRFMTTATKIQGLNQEIVILTATSGDTGKAALSGFADVDGTDIVVYYPKDGVSAVQEKQMLTQEGDNTCVIGVRGNFDDTQNGVKRIFSDKMLADQLAAKGYVLSSANSINIGRLLPQVIYYIYSYAELVRQGKIALGDSINFVVPTGNFGDILAGYYAKILGLPVHRFICASNANRVLTDFFETGDYSRNRPFYKTMSPSMDILISSNLERLLYDLSDDPKFVANLMQNLTERGEYTIPDGLKQRARQLFYGGSADEEKTAQAIADMYNNEGYLIDPHTAVASSVYDDYKAATGDTTPTVILSTASPYKFANNVYRSIFGDVPEDLSDFDILDALADKTGVAVPKPLADLKNKPNRHKGVVDKDAMVDGLTAFIKSLNN